MSAGGRSGPQNQGFSDLRYGCSWIVPVTCAFHDCKRCSSVVFLGYLDGFCDYKVSKRSCNWLAVRGLSPPASTPGSGRVVASLLTHCGTQPAGPGRELLRCQDTVRTLCWAAEHLVCLGRIGSSLEGSWEQSLRLASHLGHCR